MSANYSIIRVVCNDSSQHPRKTVNVAQYGGWGTNWTISVSDRRKSLIDKAPHPRDTEEGFPLYPGMPTHLYPRMRCRLCQSEIPQRALDPAVMIPALNHLATQGVSRLTLRQLAVVASQT